MPAQFGKIIKLSLIRRLVYVHDKAFDFIAADLYAIFNHGVISEENAKQIEKASIHLYI